MERGDFVVLEHAGSDIYAFVAFVSPDGNNLIVMFNGVFIGAVGMMALAKEDAGPYRDAAGREVKVTKTARR